MGYDPKRPRPSASDDEPAPVDALLGDAADAAPDAPTDVAPDTPTDATVDATPESAASAEPAVIGRAVPGASTNGSGPRPAPEVPVAPAPEEGTTNRAVLAAALGAVGALTVLFLWLRRRRHLRG